MRIMLTLMKFSHDWHSPLASRREYSSEASGPNGVITPVVQLVPIIAQALLIGNRMGFVFPCRSSFSQNTGSMPSSHCS